MLFIAFNGIYYYLLLLLLNLINHLVGLYITIFIFLKLNLLLLDNVQYHNNLMYKINYYDQIKNK